MPAQFVIKGMPYTTREFKLMCVRECAVEFRALDCPEKAYQFWQAHVPSAPWYVEMVACSPPAELGKPLEPPPLMVTPDKPGATPLLRTPISSQRASPVNAPDSKSSVTVNRPLLTARPASDPIHPAPAP